MQNLNSSFFFGAATSAHQVEGNNRFNDWWSWEVAGRVAPSGPACGHYERFREDAALAATLGHNAHRFSVEWSRIEPVEGDWNIEALEHYRTFLLELRARGIEPFVTLHHFTNPDWFAKKGGWESDQAVFYFGRFAKKTVEYLGEQVCFWITINEPMVYIYKSYCEGAWPPGVQSITASMRVLRSLILGHVEAYRVIHRHYADNRLGSPMVSIAKHVIQFDPCRKNSKKDRIMTAIRDWFFNHLCLQALTNGFLFFPGFYLEFLPVRDSLDFIGVNYYFRDFIRFDRPSAKDPFGEICDKRHHQSEILETTQMGWEVRPEGLYQQLIALQSYGKPLVVTENGIATDSDDQRRRYMTSHLQYTALAARQGVPILGYFYWSLLDNFEWDKGYGPKFGLVYAGPGIQERKIKPSAYVFTEMCRKLFHGGS